MEITKMVNMMVYTDIYSDSFTPEDGDSIFAWNVGIPYQITT